MFRPPALAEAEIAIAKRAGERDLTDIRQASPPGIECRRICLECSKRARHLAGLMLEPFLFVMLRSPPSRFVHGEDRSIENAIRERLQSQSREPGPRLAWNDPVAARPFVQKFQDDARVVISIAVLGDQRRDFAEWILPPQRIGGVGGIGGLDCVSDSKPKSAIAMRTLRPKGEAGDERRIIIAAPSLRNTVHAIGGRKSSCLAGSGVATARRRRAAKRKAQCLNSSNR